MLAARQTFNFRDLGEMDLKGLATPTTVCELLYEHNDPATMLKRTPFAGRAAQQLKLLSAKLEEAFNGRGSMVTICGDRGSAKPEKLNIPASVKQIVGRRVLRLSAEANRLLSVASAFNGKFSFDIALAAAELDEESALRAIDEALGAQLLRPSSRSDYFDFAHAVIRNTI
jgi:hypothetical protein